MDMDTNEIREELLHSLHEWGVSGTHQQHVDFRKKIISEGLKWLSLPGSANTCSFRHLKSQPFPDNIHDAYHHLLVSDIENLCPDQCVDRLDVKGFGEPKYRIFDRKHNPPKVIGYRSVETAVQTS